MAVILGPLGQADIQQGFINPNIIQQGVIGPVPGQATTSAPEVITLGQDGPINVVPMGAPLAVPGTPANVTAARNPNPTFAQDPFDALSAGVGDETRPSVTAPKKSPGISLMDIPIGLYEGVRRRLPEQIGQALQFSGIAPDTGKAIVDWARKGESQEPSSFVREGAEMVAPSIGVPGALYLGGKLISAIPNPIAKAVGFGMQLAAPVAGPGVMGLAEAQSTRERAQTAGVPEGNAPLINGAIEAIGETIGTIFLGRLFGVKVLSPEVKQTFKGFLKEMFFKTIPAENLTEMGQQFGQSIVDKNYGIRPNANPAQEALEVIGPTTVMTLLTGAASATHKAFTGGFEKTAPMPGAETETGLESAQGATTVPAQQAASVQQATPTQKVPDIYTMTPEVVKTWEGLIASEETGKPSTETKSFEITPESHPAGSIVKLGKHDFIIDNYTPEGVQGRRVFKEQVGGLQGEVSENVLKLYDRARNTMEFNARKGKPVNIEDIVMDAATTPGAPSYSQNDIRTVVEALRNPLHEETTLGDTETYPLEKLQAKEARIIPATQPNLTMAELEKQNFKHADDVVNYIAARKQAGVNVNSVVRKLSSDENAILSLLPEPDIKTAEKRIAIPDLFMSKPKETITEDEVDAAIDAGAKFNVIPELTKDGKKTGKMVIDYFPRDFRFFFKKKDYPNTEEGNKKLAADVKAKREYLQSKLDSFKRPEYWRIIEESDDKGRIKSIKMARLVPEYVKTTSKWMAPTADRLVNEATKASKERRLGLAKDMLATLKKYIPYKFFAGEKVRVRPGEVNIVDSIRNYIELNKNNMTPEQIKKYDQLINRFEEASNEEMDKLFGPVGKEETSEAFDLSEGISEAMPATPASLANAIPSLPGEEILNIESFRNNPEAILGLQGVRKSYILGKMIEDLEGYVSGKGTITEKRFGDIAYNMLRFKGGRDVIANFLAGNKTATEAEQAAAKREKEAKGAKGAKEGKKEKVELSADQWEDYRADVKEQLSKLTGSDMGAGRLKTLYAKAIQILITNKKLTEKEATEKVNKIKEEALARARGTVTEAEAAAGKVAKKGKEPPRTEEPTVELKKKAKEDRALWTRRNDLIRAALIKLTGLDVSKEDNIKKIAKSVIDVPVAEGKEMVDEETFKELSKIAYKKARDEFEAGLLKSVSGENAGKSEGKSKAEESAKPSAKPVQTKPEKAKKSAEKREYVEWSDFGDSGQEYYKQRIRETFGKLVGKNFKDTPIGRIKEIVLESKDVNGNVITKEVISGITSRIWDETSQKFAPEKFVKVKEARKKAEEAKAAGGAKGETTETKIGGLKAYQELMAKARELGISVPKGTKAEELLAMIEAHKAGKTVTKTAEKKKPGTKKSKQQEEISEEETKKSYEALFGKSETTTSKDRTKELSKSLPEKPTAEYNSVPDNMVVSGEYKSLADAHAALGRILMVDPENKAGYEVALINGKPTLLKGKVISKQMAVEPVVPQSEEAIRKRNANELAKQRSAIRTTISEFLRVINLNRDDNAQLILSNDEMEAMVNDIHKQFRQRGGGSKKELALYAAGKIRAKFGLPTSGESAIANKLLSIAEETGVDLDTLETIEEEKNKGVMSREDELAMLIKEQQADSGEEALKVTEIPNIDDLTGREIYEFMVKDIASRIPLVKDPVLKSRLKDMLKIDLSRTDTRWQQAERDLMELMAHFGKTTRQPMSDEYRSKVMAYVHQMRMVYGRMMGNPVIRKMTEIMVKAGYSKSQVEDFIWTIGAPFYYRQQDINHWLKQIKDPSYTRASMRTNSTVKQRENWLWLGRHWAIRKDINNGKNKPVFYFMAEITPELATELGLSEDVITNAAEAGKARYRPTMHDTVVSVTTKNGSYEIVRKYGRNFLAIDKESMINENNIDSFKLLGIDAANRMFADSEKTKIDGGEKTASDETLTRKIPLSLSVESLRKEIPAATVIYEKSPGVFHIGFSNFSVEIRNSEIQYYTYKDGKLIKISGRWKIREGGKPIIEVSKLSRDATDLFSTLHHELFHMAWDIYLTEWEQQSLINMYRKDARERHSEIIERVARAYESWNPNSKTKKSGLFAKLMNGARDILWKLHGLLFGKNYQTRDALFNAIKSGSIYARPPQLNISLDPRLRKGTIVGGGAMPTVIYPKNLSPVISDPNRVAKAEWFNPSSEMREGTPLSNTIQSTGLIDYSALDAIDERLKEDGILASMNEDTIPYNRSAWQRAIDWLKSAASMDTVGKQLSGHEVSRLEHYLSNPLFLATKFTEWARAIAIEKERSRNFQSDKYLHAKATVNFQQLNQEEQNSLDPLWVYGSAISHRYFAEDELRNPSIIKMAYDAVGSKLKTYKLTDRAIKGYLEVVAASKKLWADKLDMARMSLLKPFAQTLNTNEFAELTRLFKLLIAGKEPANIKEIIGNDKWVKTYEKDGKKHKTNDLRKAYKKLKSRYHDIQARYSDKQFLDGYAPLLHGSGPFYVAVKRTYKDENGKEKVEYVWSHHAKTEQHKEEMEASVRKHLKNYTPAEGEKIEVISGRSNKPEDSVYFMVGDMNMVRILDLAIAEMRGNDKGNISMEQAEALLDNLTDAIVDIRRIRGAGVHDIHRHMIKWDEQQTVGGYKTEGFKDIWNSYFFGYYGMRNKFEASMKHMELLKDVKRNTPILFDDLVQYAQDNMRNKDQYDRAIGIVKNAVFYWYLGAKISTALLQLTQNFAVAIPRLAMEMANTKDAKHAMFAAEGYFLKAMWDIGMMRKTSSNIDLKERAMLEYMERRGELMDRFMQEIKIAAAAHGNKMMMRALEILGWPMTYTEIFNRKSTALAYYRYLKKRGGLSEQEIYDKIDSFIDTTHWWYGPANAPAIARGGGAFARLSQLSYTFRPFTHHYVLSLWYAFQNYGGRAGAVYAARSFAWLALLGGIPALPWIDDFIELVTKATGIPIRMEAQKALRKSMGSNAEKFLASGAIGLLGDIDLSTAIKPAGLPWPLSGTIGESTMGVYAGLANKAYRAIEAGKVGDWVKFTEAIAPTAIENMVKAYRLSERGMTSTFEKPIYGPDGKRIKLDQGQAMMQFVGLKPYETSMLQHEIWENKVIQEAWNVRKQELHKMQRLAIQEAMNNKDYSKVHEVAKKFTEFNLSIPSELRGIISPIKWAAPDRIDKKMGMMWGKFGHAAPE